MPISTIVVWNPLPSIGADSPIDAKAADMQAQGKTDNVPVVSDAPYPPKTVTRTWTTVADAEEWIAFIETYAPSSATIQQT